MKVLLPIVLLVVTLSLFAGTSGSFAGTVVDGPEASGDWLYVQGHNHSVRRVSIGHAKIRYDSDVPKSERSDPIPKTLPAGTRVRVTAQQDESGEWRANDIEILNGSSGDEDKKKDPAATTSQT
jgi:hypothetical protein